jgi:hypothetical protein
MQGTRRITHNTGFKRDFKINIFEEMAMDSERERLYLIYPPMTSLAKPASSALSADCAAITSHNITVVYTERYTHMSPLEMDSDP